MILGLDPGKNGAACLMDYDGQIHKILSFSKLSTIELIREVATMSRIATHIFIERVASSPQQGVVSAFTFGKNFGALLGVIYAWRPINRIIQIRPAEWQGALGCLSGGSKTTLLEHAKKLYWKEHRAKMYNKSSADAVLIAHYGFKKVALSNPFAPCEISASETP